MMASSIQQALMSHFNEIDADHDNFLTKDELEAYSKTKMTADNKDAVIGAGLLGDNKQLFDMAEVAQYHGTADGKIGYGDLQAVDSAVDEYNSMNSSNAGSTTGSDTTASTGGDSSQSGLSGMMSSLKGMMSQVSNALLGSMFTQMNNAMSQLSNIFGKLFG